MAVTTGFSEPYVAKYGNVGATVTYSGGMKLGRGVSMSVEVESADDNNFYADDQIARHYDFRVWNVHCGRAGTRSRDPHSGPAREGAGNHQRKPGGRVRLRRPHGRALCRRRRAAPCDDERRDHVGAYRFHQSQVQHPRKIRSTGRPRIWTPALCATTPKTTAGSACSRGRPPKRRPWRFSKAI